MGVPRLSLNIGGVGFVLSSAEPTLQLTFDAPTGRFLAPADGPAFHLEVRRGNLGSDPAGTLVFEDDRDWRLTRVGADWVFDFFTPLNGSRPFRRARVSELTLSGEIVFDARYLGDAPEVDALQYPLAELLVIRRLAASGGVLLHACGLVEADGCGIVLAGRSGDGKTTSARLWSAEPDVQILSDDRIIVRPADGGFRMFGTPWHGEAGFAANAEASLAGVFILEHGGASFAEPLRPETAVATLLPRCFPPFEDRVGVERVLDSLSALAASVPCFRLPFTPDRSAVQAVRRAMAGVC